MIELNHARDQAAVAADIEFALQMALIAAMTVEASEGSEIVRDQTAVAVPQALAASNLLRRNEGEAVEAHSRGPQRVASGL